jgi:hypothetical protein
LLGLTTASYVLLTVFSILLHSAQIIFALAARVSSPRGRDR